jgi:hypothetical protein
MKGGAQVTIDAAGNGAAAEFAKGLLRKAPPEPSSLLWETFWDVGTMRPPAFAGAAPIPIDKLQWYAETLLGYDDEEADAFVWIMRQVDSAFVALIAEQQSKDSK